MQTKIRTLRVDEPKIWWNKCGIYITRHSVEKWNSITGILYYLLLNLHDNGSWGTTQNINIGICSECIATVTKIENIMVRQHKDKCVYEKF